MGIENHIPEGMGIISYQDLLEEIERESNQSKRIKMYIFSLDNVTSEKEYQQLIKNFKKWNKYKEKLVLKNYTE